MQFYLRHVQGQKMSFSPLQSMIATILEFMWEGEFVVKSPQVARVKNKIK